MSKKIIKAIIMIMALTVVAAFAGCASGQKDPKSTSKPVQTIEDTTYPYTFSDTAGNSVTIKAEPKRIITVGPNLTETVYALGKGSILVGRTEYDDYPAEVSGVDSIGDLTTPNIEKIIDLEPDVVFVSGTVMPDNIAQMKQNGLPVVIVNDHMTFEGVYDTILMIGNVLNANAKASEIVDGMKAKIAEVESKVKDLQKPTVYYIVGYGEYGDYTATGDTFIGVMLEKAGGDNIAKNETGWTYSKEALIEKDPSVIICSKFWDTKKGFVASPGYKDLTAVKNDYVFELDENLVTRQGPRLADGLLVLAKILHPEAFE